MAGVLAGDVGERDDGALFAGGLAVRGSVMISAGIGVFSLVLGKRDLVNLWLKAASFRGA